MKHAQRYPDINDSEELPEELENFEENPLADEDILDEEDPESGISNDIPLEDFFEDEYYE